MSDYEDDFEGYEDEFEEYDEAEAQPPSQARAPLSYEEELQLAIARENDAAHRVAVRQTIQEGLAEQEARPLGAMTMQQDAPAVPLLQLPSKESLQLSDARAAAGEGARKRLQRLWPHVKGRLKQVAINLPEERSLELRLIGRFVRVDMATQASLLQDEQQQTEAVARPDLVHQGVQMPEHEGAEAPGLQRRRKQLLGGDDLRAAEGRAQSAMLRQARTVVCKVLEARKLKLSAGTAGEGVPGSPLVASRIHLDLPPELKGRRVAALSVSGGSEAKVLAALQPEKTNRPLEERIQDHSAGGRAALVVWHPSSGTRADPSDVLVCEGSLTCCAWGCEGLDNLVLGGTEEGSVHLWDLSARLPAASEDAAIKENHLPLQAHDRWRRPCSSTEHGAGFFVHDHAIVSVACVPLDRAEAHRGEGELSLGLGSGTSTSSRLLAHVVVLDASCRVSVWDLREQFGLRDLGSRFTLSLAQPSVPMGRAAGRSGLAQPIEVYRASSSTHRAGDHAEDSGLEDDEPIFDGDAHGAMASRLAVALQARREFLLVATSSGRVLKGSRAGAVCPSPWEYELGLALEGEDAALAGLPDAFPRVPLVDLATCPRDEAFFATSGADGAVHVFHTESRVPLAALVSESQRPPLATFWSRLRPQTVLKVDVAGQLTVWDLTAGPDRRPGAVAVVGATATEDLAKAAGVPSISSVAMAPRAPGEYDLIAVAAGGAVKCLLLKTPPQACRTDLKYESASSLHSASTDGHQSLFSKKE